MIQQKMGGGLIAFEAEIQDGSPQIKNAHCPVFKMKGLFTNASVIVYATKCVRGTRYSLYKSLFALVAVDPVKRLLGI